MAWNMSWSELVGTPCARSTRIAYSRLEHNDSNEKIYDIKAAEYKKVSYRTQIAR